MLMGVYSPQVWINLISNAIKYSANKETPIVEIGSDTKENEIIFYIKVNVAGFNMNYVDKLFGVFQRFAWDRISRNRSRISTC